MQDIEFLWDDRKVAANLRKHRVSFQEAITAFYDEDALHIPDPDHSLSKERFVLLGMSSRLRVLIVCHCFRAGDSAIRIYSARRATRRERELYERAL
jgi:uncharacterized protein